MQAQPQYDRGKPALDASDYIEVARRHAGWIFGFAFAALVVSVVCAYLWPDTFRSTASIRYRAGSVPNLDEHRRSSLTRTELKNIIDRYDLYPSDVKRLPIEDVIENMKRKIHIGRAELRGAGNPRVEAFPVAFDYQDRFKAQKVLSDVVTLLTKPSLGTKPEMKSETGKAGSELREATIQSTRDALDAARKDLESQETLVADFRTRHEGNLPEQARSDQEMMSTLRIGLAKVQNEIARATREQADLQASLASELEKRRTLKESMARPSQETPETPNPKLAEFDAQIQAIEDQIKALKVQYTENFPDVKLARQRLEKIRGDRDAIAREEAAKIAAAKQSANAESARAEAAFDAEMKRFQTQISVKAAEIEKLNKEAAEDDRGARSIQAKLEGASGLEKEYADLLRDRDLKKSVCDELEIRYQAQLTAMASVAGNQPTTEGFELFDPPSLPVQPVEPNRAMLIGAGSVLGLLAGLVAAGAREANERSFRNRFGLGSRPREYGSVSAAKAGRRVSAAWTAAILIGLGAMAASVTHYYVTKV